MGHNPGNCHPLTGSKSLYSAWMADHRAMRTARHKLYRSASNCLPSLAQVDFPKWRDTLEVPLQNMRTEQSSACGAAAGRRISLRSGVAEMPVTGFGGESPH